MSPVVPLYPADRGVRQELVCRALDLVHELAGIRFHPRSQQESACGVVRAFLGEHCAYPGLGWRRGHRRAR